MLTIVYDNKTLEEDLKAGHGFSCLVETGGARLLFDTGDSPEALSHNMETLGIDASALDAIALSHNHWDHTGGLEAVIEKKGAVTVYMPHTFPAEFTRGLKRRGARCIGVKGAVQVRPGIFVGPTMRGMGPDEIPLVIDGKNGLIVITGCAHPGIVKMVKKLEGLHGKDIDIVMGGFHLEWSPNARGVAKALKAERVRRAAPCHCTGSRAIEAFADEFKGGFMRIGAGTHLLL